MLALSLVSLMVAMGSILLSYKIKDDVFKVGMNSTALLFFIVTLVCAPWLLKLTLVAIPFVFARLNPWSVENIN